MLFDDALQSLRRSAETQAREWEKIAEEDAQAAEAALAAGDYRAANHHLRNCNRALGRSQASAWLVCRIDDQQAIAGLVAGLEVEA